jgi:hypothetical protein
MPYLNEMLNWDVTHQFVGETRYMYKCVKKPKELLA